MKYESCLSFRFTYRKDEKGRVIILRQYSFPSQPSLSFNLPIPVKDFVLPSKLFFQSKRDWTVQPPTYLESTDQKTGSFNRNREFILEGSHRLSLSMGTCFRRSVFSSRESFSTNLVPTHSKRGTLNLSPVSRYTERESVNFTLHFCPVQVPRT